MFCFEEDTIKLGLLSSKRFKRTLLYVRILFVYVIDFY